MVDGVKSEGEVVKTVMVQCGNPRPMCLLLSWPVTILCRLISVWFSGGMFSIECLSSSFIFSYGLHAVDEAGAYSSLLSSLAYVLHFRTVSCAKRRSREGILWRLSIVSFLL